MSEGQSRPGATPQGEELFRLMVEAVRDYSIFALDPEGRVVRRNAGAEKEGMHRAKPICNEGTDE